MFVYVFTSANVCLERMPDTREEITQQATVVRRRRRNRVGRFAGDVAQSKQHLRQLAERFLAERVNESPANASAATTTGEEARSW